MTTIKERFIFLLTLRSFINDAPDPHFFIGIHSRLESVIREGGSGRQFPPKATLEIIFG